MSLILSTGSNLNDRLKYINAAKNEISKRFNILSESRIYESFAVDYTEQGKFLNQVLELSLPSTTPLNVLNTLLDIENNLGRVRTINKGPRTLDIDILFWGIEMINKPNLEVPHPRLFERSFIVKPLSELPFYASLKKHFSFPTKFENEAWPYTP